MKLQHYLSKNQIFSRRVADRMVSEGYVTVDGHLITDSLFNIEDENQVGFKSKINDYIESLGFVLFNKPRGVWTNCKQGFNEKEVIDLLPKRFQNYASIGRLDKDSEGLILFTNDGVFANRFLNSNEIHSREYLVTTKRPLSLKQMHRLEAGVILKDGMTKPCEIYELKKCQYRFRLIEGKNRQIRRMIETCETFVTRLKRLQFGDFSLGSILPGQYKFKSLKDDFYCRLKQTGISID